MISLKCNWSKPELIGFAGYEHDAKVAAALMQVIEELRALPYINEATAAEIFDQIDIRTASLLAQEYGVSP